MVTRDETVVAVIKFVKEEIVHSFGPPKTITRDNTSSLEMALQNFAKEHGINCKALHLCRTEKTKVWLGHGQGEKVEWFPEGLAIGNTKRIHACMDMVFDHWLDWYLH